MTALVPWPYPPGGVLEYLKSCIFSQQGKDKWVWAIARKEEPLELIGVVDLWRQGRPENRGFWLAHKYWGRGYMTEAVEPVMDYAFDNLGFEKLVFTNAAGNPRSGRVKEKTGAKLVGRMPASYVDPALTEAEIYELTKAEWQEFKKRRAVHGPQIRQSQFVSPSVSGIKAVLFDCDGVLCPPMRFAEVLERQHGITRGMTAEFFRGAFLPALLGKVDVLSLLPPFLEQWCWGGTPRTFLDLWLSSEKELSAEVVEMICELRRIGYFVGLATNQESHRARYFRSEMDFERIFEKCFISCELGQMKPQSGYFHEVTKQIGVPPQQIIFLDDQQTYLDAAAEHNWRSILFTTAQEASEQLEAMLRDAAQGAT